MPRADTIASPSRVTFEGSTDLKTRFGRTTRPGVEVGWPPRALKFGMPGTEMNGGGRAILRAVWQNKVSSAISFTASLCGARTPNMVVGQIR